MPKTEGNLVKVWATAWVVYNPEGFPYVTHRTKRLAIGEFVKEWGCGVTWKQCHRDGFRCLRVAPVGTKS